MTSHLNIYRLLIIASLALNLWIPLIIEAADRLPGSGIPEIMDGPISSHANPPATTAVAPAQTTGVDDIANALGSYFKANYPTYDFAPYLKKLTLVREALGRGDRRTVKVEMGAFFKLLTNRSHGISEGAADELTNFARMVMPVQEYGIFFPRSGPDEYRTAVPRPWSEQ